MRWWIRVLLLGAGLGAGIFFILPWLASQIYFRDYMGDYEVFGLIASTPIENLYGRYRFPYPPSALILIRAFGGLSFWWAYAAWVGSGLVALSVAARRMVTREAIVLGFLSYAGIGLIVSGQTSLFIAALIIAGVTTKRPALASVLLGVAAAIKPQALLAAPIMMIASRNYRGIAWAALTGALMVLLSLALWGPDLWVRWFTNLHHFPTYLQVRHLDAQDKGLYGLLLQYGLPGWLYVIAIPLAAICAWKVFRSDAGPLDRYSAFATSTILMSPYTLSYDLAALSIAAVGLLLDQRRSLLIWVAAAFILTSAWANYGVILLALALTMQWWTPQGRQAEV